MNWMEYVNAFWVGGAICAVCQVFIDRTRLTPARILVSLVVIGGVFAGHRRVSAGSGLCGRRRDRAAARVRLFAGQGRGGGGRRAGACWACSPVG